MGSAVLKRLFQIPFYDVMSPAHILFVCLTIMCFFVAFLPVFISSPRVNDFEHSSYL